MKTSGYGLLACLPILASLLQACGTPPPPPQAPPPKIGTAKALQGDVAIWKEWVGALDGMVNAQIRAQVTGYLIKRNYQEGDKVKKGQMLYEIDPRTFKAAVEQARATLAQHQAILTAAELDLARIQKLLPEKPSASGIVTMPSVVKPRRLPKSWLPRQHSTRLNLTWPLPV